MNTNHLTSPKKILVADDEPNVIKTIFRYFTDAKEPYVLLSANNGAVAHQIAREALPDLIIMDWEMPQLSGLMVLSMLKKTKETCHIPIIIVTGKQVEDHNLEEALDTGAVDYIRKPFSPLELLARARSALYIAELRQKEQKMAELLLDAKNRELSAIALQVAQKNQLLDRVAKKLELSPTQNMNTAIRECLKEIESGLDLDKQWEVFKRHFETVHPNFFTKLEQSYDNLTLNDLKMCAYIKMHLAPKEVMRILNLSKKGLEAARYRIKKRIGLGAYDDLDKFIRNFDN